MAYKNGTYVAFDGNATTNPTEGDMKYYALLQSWNASNKFELTFSDSHKKTHQVKDSSLKQTLQARLLERMKNSKNMMLIISDNTDWDRGMLNYEIEKAIDYYKIPLIIAYPGYESILDPSGLSSKWPKALAERIENKTARCIHIPFKQKAIASAVSRFSLHSTNGDILTLPLHYFDRSVYVDWGYIKD